MTVSRGHATTAPDIGKVEAAIGWTPTRPLDETLGDVFTFHQAEAVVV